MRRAAPYTPNSLMEKFGELGIDVRLRSEVEQINKRADDFTVHATTNGQRQKVTADLVAHAAGREPDLVALDLAAGSVATENGRVKLNEFLQSVSNPRVYAAGDATGSGPALTPVSAHDGVVVAKNLIDGNRHRPDYGGVPSVAFTIPRSPLSASARPRHARRGSNSECIRRKLRTGTPPCGSMNQSTASRH